MKLCKHKLVIFMLMGTVFLILPVQSRADKKPDEVKIPQSIYPGLHHFFDLVDPEKNDDWDYFYSNKKGLTLPALGWVSSYMYGSGAINIYYEIDPGSPKVRCAMFKWLQAGWSGINMVQRKHIYKGLKRFARPFKEIMEYPSLPPVEVLASDFSQIRKFSDDVLRAKMDIYSDILKRRYIGDNHNGKKWLPKLLADKDHWSGMSREEMESALVIEYMKAVIGKTPAADIDKLLEF